MISAVVLSYNDEKTIGIAISHVQWCDEVLVIDDFSRDKTRAIAKRLGATVFRRNLDDNFADQRNFGLSKAKGPWVLFVDSDEIITPQLAGEIRRVISGSAVGYYFKRRDYLFGRWLNHGETSNVRLLRLAKKHAGRWVRPIHEVWSVKGETGELREPILHYPHPNVAQFIEDINRYTTLNAAYLYSQKIRCSFWHIVGYPAAKFFVNYFWYLGLLDGTAGIVHAILMSFHSFLTRAKLYMLWRKKTYIDS